METRKESLSVLKLCRFCLAQDGSLTTLYDRKRAPKNAVSLPLKILSCMSIEVFPSDKMPSYICQRCKFFMDITYEFKQICRQADENILQFVQKGTEIESISWPSKLIQLFPIKAKKSPEFSVLETTEGGATVQVTTHDDSDSEDEENLIDIKIADGSDEGTKGTSIKLVSGTNDDSKRKLTRSRKDSEDIEMTMTSSQATGISDGCWPCDECDCTYPLQQLLELHKMQKHRERTVSCLQCNAKFFTKYDLAVHELRHSDEMMFQCVACDKQFKRHILLKRHEKIMHADLPQQHCPQCPATFLSLEELEIHQQKHRPKQVACPLCEKKFHDKASLQRHKEMIHEKKGSFCCEYCPESFPTVSKLTRHLRDHAGERAYPCKYCDKTFVKSHHYTRHLRLKHRELGRIPKEQYDDIQDQYPCDQCDDCFTSQDELIYHSAIHATQNLICPLCQEKFDDVEAVTTHIKSHVNGTEFMCDFCELVFTTQDKLHIHIASAHEEELRNTEQEVEQEESSIEMEADDDDENDMNAKDENDHLVVEIKKSHEFMLSNTNETEDQHDNTNSEDSEAETTYTELATVDTLALTKETNAPTDKPSKTTAAVLTKLPRAPPKPDEKGGSQTASILRKAEDMKRKMSQQQSTDTNRAQNKKANASAPTGANDKSLRLLEKELQELKRTNTRSSDAIKTPAKNAEILKNKRPQIHTSTPKPTRITTEEKKSQVAAKPVVVIEKKQQERRIVTKENKEPKEQKSNSTSAKEKEKETPKNNVKNGTNEKNVAEENVRRSTRPSKIKDYAKMVNDRSQDSEDDNDSDYNEESDAGEIDNEAELQERSRVRRASLKPTPAKPASAGGTTTAPRKRGRPRKEKAVPAKIKKDDNENEGEEVKQDKSTADTIEKPKETAETTNNTEEKSKSPENSASPESTKVAPEKPDLIVSPTGHTLKKVPVRALPPGIKPLPLPVSARGITGGEVCEMQIGKKMVKVQKIIMTKAEVEAMAKKGLVEMKDGTMVLKQGIKLPTSDPATFKSSLVGDTNANKEAPVKKAAPTRCDLEEL